MHALSLSTSRLSRNVHAAMRLSSAAPWVQQIITTYPASHTPRVQAQVPDTFLHTQPLHLAATVATVVLLVCAVERGAAGPR